MLCSGDLSFAFLLYCISQVAEVLVMDVIRHFSAAVLIVSHLWSRQLLTCLCDKPFSTAPSHIVDCITPNVEINMFWLR